MERLDKINSVVYMKIFWWSIASPKWDFYLKWPKHKQKILSRPVQFQKWIFPQISLDEMKKTDFKKNWFFSSKISIWVLKRNILTGWIRFLIIKILQRSFHIWKRYIMEIYILLIKNIPYLSTDRSPKNFIIKTSSLCQDDSFKYPYWYF